MFLGALFDLSQSHPSCAAHPEDLEPLATSGYLDPILPTGLLLISDLDRLGFFPSFPSFHGP